MKYLKILGLAAVAAAAMMAFAGSASATILTSPECKTNAITGACEAGLVIHAEAEGHAVLDPPIGKIECPSTVQGKTANEGNSSETVKGPIEVLTFPNCTAGAVVNVLKKGELIIHTRTASVDGNGTLTSNGAEVEVRAFGFNCIFSTKETDIGTLTGGKTATLDIEATIPRTGGGSGAFCGAEAKWTGSYKVDTPDSLTVD